MRAQDNHDFERSAVSGFTANPVTFWCDGRHRCFQVQDRCGIPNITLRPAIAADAFGVAWR